MNNTTNNNNNNNKKNNNSAREMPKRKVTFGSNNDPSTSILSSHSALRSSSASTNTSNINMSFLPKKRAFASSVFPQIGRQLGSRRPAPGDSDHPSTIVVNSMNSVNTLFNNLNSQFLTDMDHRESVPVFAYGVSMPTLSRRGLPQTDEYAHHTNIVFDGGMQVNELKHMLNVFLSDSEIKDRQIEELREEIRILQAGKKHEHALKAVQHALSIENSSLMSQVLELKMRVKELEQSGHGLPITRSGEGSSRNADFPKAESSISISTVNQSNSKILVISHDPSVGDIDEDDGGPLVILPSDNSSTVPKKGEILLIFLQIQGVVDLWVRDATSMRVVMQQYNAIVRQECQTFNGSEVFAKGLSCLYAFPSSSAAAGLRFALSVQTKLFEASWPEILTNSPMACVMRDPMTEEVILTGLRVAVCLNIVQPQTCVNPFTNRMEYYGESVDATAQLLMICFGGEILCTKNVIDTACLQDPTLADQHVSLSLGENLQLNGSEMFSVAGRSCHGRLRLFAVVRAQAEFESTNESIAINISDRQKRNSSSSSLLAGDIQHIIEEKSFDAEAIITTKDDGTLVLKRTPASVLLLQGIENAAEIDSKPNGKVCIVWLQICGFDKLLHSDSMAVQLNLVLYHQLIDVVIEKHNGYKSRSENDKVMLAFADVVQAVACALKIQEELMKVSWTEQLLLLNEAAPLQLRSSRDVEVFRGFRVQIGMHVCKVMSTVDHFTHAVHYYGPHVNVAVCMCNTARQGEIVVSAEVYRLIQKQTKELHNPVVASQGNVRMQLKNNGDNTSCLSMRVCIDCCESQ